MVLANTAKTQVLTNTNKFTLVKEISLKKYKNERFTLRADVKNVPTDSTGKAKLFLLQVGKRNYDFIENSGQTKQISSKDTCWTSYSISGRVKKGAKRIWVYLITEGNGDYYFDNLSFKVEINDNIWTKNLFRKGNFESVSKPIKMFSNRKYIEVNKDKKIDITLNNGVGYGKSLHLSIKNNQQVLKYRCGNDSNNGKFVKSNNTKIYYEVYGKGDPLLLLHGNGQSISDFSKQIPEFAKHFKVIAVDTRGQGNSIDTISKKFSYNQFSEDMKVLLDTLHLKQVNLVGWSDGGNTGLTLAMKYPQYVKRLVTMGANLNPSDKSISRKVKKRIRKDIAKLKKNGNYKVAVRLLEMLLREPNILPSELEKISAKTLILAGEKDIILEQHTKLIGNSISNSKVIILKKQTHFLPHENPKLFNKTVLEFLLK